jgi:hypothetical protein
MHFAVNWLAIVIAAVVSMAIGAIWYTVLGKQWLSAIGKTREQISGADWTPFAWGFAVQLVMAYFIALVTPALFGTTDIWNGILAGAHMWLGFGLTAMVLNHRYQGMPWRLTAIDGGYLLLVLVSQGIVIGVFGGGSAVAA